MKNSQVAVLCAVFLLGAAIVAASNWLLFWSLIRYESTPHNPLAPTSIDGTATARTNKKITVAMMPKSKGNAYFIACRKGAEEAARELGVDLIWDGPTDPDPAKQNEIIEAWITRGVDVIAVSAENRDAISSVLKKARRAGCDIITFDADTGPDSREYFVNQATPEEIGYKLMDRVADVTAGKGEFAVITASLTAANQNEWLKYIEKRRASLYPGMKMAVLRACDDLQKKAFDETTTILNAYPDVKVILAICSPAVPGAAEAVKQSGRKDVKVVGLGLPNDNKQYVHEGITPAVVLWNTMDLGYLTVYTATAVARGKLMPGDKTLAAGRLGEVKIQGDNVLLGEPFTFKKDNIDQFSF